MSILTINRFSRSFLPKLITPLVAKMNRFDLQLANFAQPMISSSLKFPRLNSQPALHPSLPAFVTITSLPVSTRANQKPIKPLNQLKIEKVDSEDYPEIIKTARIWSEIADEMRVESSPKFRDRFSASSSICMNIADCLEHTPRLLEREVYVCKDEENRFQGIMLVRTGLDTDSIDISYLVTHPNNIRSSQKTNDTERVKGVGSSLLHFIEEKAKELKKVGVFLQPEASSLTFYQERGYKMHGLHGYMLKTAEQISPKS